MATDLPGSTRVGYGFNVLDAGGDGPLTRPLFKLYGSTVTKITAAGEGEGIAGRAAVEPFAEPRPPDLTVKAPEIPSPASGEKDEAYKARLVLWQAAIAQWRKAREEYQQVQDGWLARKRDWFAKQGITWDSVIAIERTASTYKLPGTNVEFAVPINVMVESVDAAQLTAEVETNCFESKRELDQSLEIDASVSAAKGKLAGDASAKVKFSTKQNVEHLYTVVTRRSAEYHASLYSTTAFDLEPAVLEHEHYRKLPAVYTAADAHLFRRFLDTFGTHFIQRVTLGSRLDYCMAIEKSYLEQSLAAEGSAEARAGSHAAPTPGKESAAPAITMPPEPVKTTAMSEEQYKERYAAWLVLWKAYIDELGARIKQSKDSRERAQALAAVEYGGTAAASASWSQTDKAWSQHRQVRIRTIGGASDKAVAVESAAGQSYAVAFKEWCESARTNPSIIRYELRPISDVFAGDRALAVDLAIEAYLRERIDVEARTDGAAMSLLGRPLFPEATPRERSFGFQVAAIERGTLAVSAQRHVAHEWGAGGPTLAGAALVYAHLDGFLDKYGDGKHIIALASFGMVASFDPPDRESQVRSKLRSIGASSNLAGWGTEVGRRALGNAGEAFYPDFVNYVLVGIPGSGMGTGYERLTAAAPTHGYVGNEPFRLGTPAPPAALAVPVHWLRSSP